VFFGPNPMKAARYPTSKHWAGSIAQNAGIGTGRAKVRGGDFTSGWIVISCMVVEISLVITICSSRNWEAWMVGQASLVELSHMLGAQAEMLARCEEQTPAIVGGRRSLLQL
jgi:hypothetical protein